MTPYIVDLFAGPGGWDLGARAVGLDPVGFELDVHALATRRRNGLRTVSADLSRYGPDRVDDVEGLIASPPCPAFSAAGLREGVEWLDHLIDVAARLHLGAHPLDDLTAILDPAAPPEATLSLVPLAWVLHHRPRWVAWEQVPAVLSLWEACAERLAAEGYEAALAAVVNAADYGVPQTRRRAILLAHRDRPITWPAPTHHRTAGDLPRWVSMGEALTAAGLWPRPCLTVDGTTALGFPRLDDRGDSPDGYRERDWFPADGPAPTLTEKLRSMQWRPPPWVWERPATPVTGDSRLWPPGHKVNADDIARLGDDEARRRYGDRAGTDAIRLTIEEAQVLQTIPLDHVICAATELEGQASMFPGLEPLGPTAHRATQVGNAVPPLLARHLLAAVTERSAA